MESMGQAVSSNTIIGIVWQSIASIGWYLVGLIIVLFYFRENFYSWKSKRDEEAYAAKYHKDPDVARERLSAVEAARQRMQEKYKKDIELSKKKKEEIEEKKKQKLLKEQSGGNQLGGESSSSSKSRLLKEEYNPLMGSSNRGYRPEKRSCCGKGGCG